MAVLCKNPVLPGFHPDPSIVQVNGEYFIANSTFEWYPGVEIHRSRNLVDWERVPSPLASPRLLDMTGCMPSCGIWAPCLSYADGLFWLIYTNVRSWGEYGPWKDSPNFLTTAPSIEGPWSDPVFLTASGFDPSLFHDDDGRKWLVSMEWDYRKTGWENFSGLLVQECGPAEKRLPGSPRKIFLGSQIGMVEGPHIYKRDGMYYILAAEGGTSYEHAATVARSKTLEGPYELHPENPLISAYGRDTKIKKAGHASWCDTPDGRSYLAFLCGRPLPGTDRCVLGRETSLAELEWKDGWPWIKHSGATQLADGLGGNYPDEAFSPPLPGAAPADAGGFYPPAQHSRRYDFAALKEIPGDFMTLRNAPQPGVYSLTDRPGFLRIRGGESPVSFFHQSLLARRQTDFSFTAETCLEFEPAYFQEFAGLSWRYDEGNQYLLAVSFEEGWGKTVRVLTLRDRKFEISAPAVVRPGIPLYLGLTVRGRSGFFRISEDGKHWRVMRPELDASLLSDEYPSMGFTGAFVGLFCCDTASYRAAADFAYLDYKAENDTQDTAP